MITSAINDANSSFGGGLRLKLLLLIGIPVLVQMLLICALWSLRSFADSRAVYQGLARECASAVGIVITKSLTIAGFCDMSLQKDLMIDYNCEKELSKLKVWSAWIAENGESSSFSQAAKGISDDAETLATVVRRSCRHNQVIVSRQKLQGRTIEGDSKITPKQLEPKVIELERRIESNAARLNECEKIYREKIMQRIVAPQNDLLYVAAVVGIFFNLLALVILSFVFSRNIIARLAAVQENVSQIERRGRLLPPLDGQDEIASLDHTFHEMAAVLDQVEEKERALFDNSYNVLSSIDPNHKFLEVNKASLRALGYQPHEMVGKTVEMFVPGDERAGLQKRLEAAIIGERQSSFELTMQRRNGATLQTLWSTSATQDGQKVFCVMHDVSERKAAQQLRKEMVQMVTHDLRSPLNSLGVVYVMLRENRFGQLNEKGQRFLAAAEANASRMLRLINDLLDIERLEAGMVQLEKSSVRLTTLVDQSLDSVLPLANKKQINLYNNSANSTLVANVDPHRIMQVLTNLLSNAIKFSPNGGNITVALHADETFVEISVADQGRGIPPELLKDVFNRFQQVQKADATEKGGSGLGLAICKSLVELHGGSLSVRSAVGKGSIFIVKLPLAGARY